MIIELPRDRSNVLVKMQPTFGTILHQRAISGRCGHRCHPIHISSRHISSLRALTPLTTLRHWLDGGVRVAFITAVVDVLHGITAEKLTGQTALDSHQYDQQGELGTRGCHLGFLFGEVEGVGLR